MLDYSREFIVLAERLNYASAAEHLHMSTSALSRHIADLEQELGFPLFNRAPLSLTPAGQYYLESIDDLIGNLDRIISRGKEIAAQDGRPFTIYMLPCRTTFSDIVYKAAAELRRRNPELATAICVDDRFLTTEEALLQHKADIGVVYDGSIIGNEAIATVQYAQAPLSAWVCRANPLAQLESLSLEDLAPYAHPRSTNRQSQTATDSIAKLFQNHGIDVQMHFRNITTRADFFLALRPDEFVIEFEEDADPLRLNPDLVQLHFDPPLTRPVLLAYLKGNSDPAIRQFVDCCLTFAQESTNR